MSSFRAYLADAAWLTMTAPEGTYWAMAIRKIARMGHPILRRPAAPVADPTSAQIAALIDDMVETMIDADGAGLAAPQIYEPVRLVVFQAPAERGEASEGTGEEAFDETAPLTVLINPEITVLDETLDLGWEGCLSVPGLRGLVPRAKAISYRGMTPEGEMLERRAQGFHARVVQHECDHLDGVLYPQRMQDMRGLIFETEVKHMIAAAAEEQAEDEFDE